MSLKRFSRIDYWSLAAIPVETYFNDQLAAFGTAFLWEFAGKTYLVTALHVVSGQHWQTKRNLSRTAIRPNMIRVWLNPDDGVGFPKVPAEFRLKDSDDNPVWLEAPEHGSDVDVALLPLELPPRVQTWPINLLPEGNLEFGIGQDLFVLGYPMNDQALRLPIWKRASLASEPEIPDAIQPYWLVDTASRSGMSGAPVIQRAYSYDAGAEGFIERFKNPGHKGKSSFVGVYSGRFRVPEGGAPDETRGDDAADGAKESRKFEDLQLGIVWPMWWILRIIKGDIGDAAFEAELQRQREEMFGRATPVGP